MYCLKCETENIGVYSIRNGILTHTKFYENGDYDVCESVPVSSPPPEMTEDDWEWTFAHEPSKEEFDEMEREYSEGGWYG